MLKLSIGIPTYNRCDYLDRLLSLLFEEEKISEVEIVISDNASEDSTESIVKKWQKKLLNINYVKNKKNIGFDRNLENTIKNANGEYIWILGDDDGIVHGSLSKLLDSINTEEDVLILNGFFCNSNLEILRNRNGVEVQENVEFKVEKIEDLVSYVKLIKNDISFLFAFISGLVINRKKWVDTISKEMEFNRTGYDHVFIVISILSKGGNFKYLKDNYYLAAESMNEYAKEPGKHFLLDVECFYKFFNFYTQNQILRKEIGRVFKNSSTVIKFVNLINYSKKINNQQQLDEYLNYFFLEKEKKYKLARLICFFKLDKFLPIARKIKRMKEKKI